MEQNREELSMSAFRKVMLIFGVMVFALTASRAFAAETEDLDNYKVRVEAVWWFSHPSGSFNGQNSSGEFDINRDFGFGDYSTFVGLFDWRFKRKHHLLFGVTPVVSDKTAAIQRSIEFEGQTFNVGASINANIKSLSFSPGYQYDIIRRNRGYLAFVTQVNLMKTSATLKATGTLDNESVTQTASGSILAPLPVVGTRFRWYPLSSNRLALDGGVQGMYFFGYGDFLSAKAAAVIVMKPHLNLRLGYQMGTRLSIHGTDNTIGIRLMQKGPMAGIEMSW
jgi:hypothetical protein